MNFYEHGLAERKLIEDWADKYFNGVDYDIEIEHTDAAGFDVYDSIIKATHRTNVEAPTVLIIETKIRNKHYDKLMLEKAKNDALNDKLSELDADCIVYLQQTPKGIYAFDLVTLQGGFKWQQKELIYLTCDRSKGSRMKTVTYIDCNQAFHVIIND